MCIILLWFLRDMVMRILLLVSLSVIKLCMFFFCIGEVGFLYNSSLFVLWVVNFSDREFILYCFGVGSYSYLLCLKFCVENL